MGLISTGRGRIVSGFARPGRDVPLAALVARMAAVDLVLVEGFAQEPIPRIEVFRPSLGKPPYFPDDSGIIAVASDALVEAGGRAVLALNEPAQVVAFILAHVRAP
jgi:molybdopterin-guanine dinucleotide biosynthesis protein B